MRHTLMRSRNWSLIHGGADVTPGNWSVDYVLMYGGAYGEEEQVFRG